MFFVDSSVVYLYLFFMKYENLNSLVGHTPILRVNNLVQAPVKLYAKLEYYNPFSSAKDRVAFKLLEGALERGDIDKDGLVVEPTSGNTGIALAAACASMGMKCMIIMPENMSEERKRLVRAFGAQLVLTPKEKGIAGSLEEAQRVKKEKGNVFIPNQFENPDNPLAHYLSTGPEIYSDLPEIDILVCAFGTGGTICGCAKYLKEKKDVMVVGVEPAESPLVSEGRAGAHIIQGIGANFIPPNFDRTLVDEIVAVKGEDAVTMSRLAMRKSGIFAGISSGAALKAASDIALKHPDKTVLAILTDTAERYLSGILFEDQGI